MNYKEPNFDAFISDHKASKETVDKRKKEKAEADKALDVNQSINKEYKKAKDLEKSAKKDLDKFINEKNSLEKELSDLKNSLNGTLKNNATIKASIEKEIRTKESRLNFVNNQISNYTKKVVEYKNLHEKLGKELNASYDKYQKEKAEFDAAHKKALAEHKKAVDTSVEQSNFNKIKNEIATIQRNINTKNTNINNWNNRLTNSKQRLDNLNKEISSIYEGLKTAGITLKKAGEISNEDINSINNLRKINPKDSKVITFDNAFNLLVAHGKTRNNLNTNIKTLEKNIADGKKYISDQTNLKAKKEIDYKNFLVQAKQKGINIIV